MNHSKIFTLIVFGILALSATVYGLDRIENTLPASISSGQGSTGNTLQIFSGAMQYVNTDNDSTTVGNSFSGTYYDSVYGSFRLNWSNDQTRNGRIGRPTNKCLTGYGYELTGSAQSSLGGLVSLAPSSVNFVYFCEDTGLLYGFGYGAGIGWQNFNGLALRAVSQSDVFTTGLSSLNDPFNFNRTTTLNQTGSTINQVDRKNAIE
jgi:hypothetical protein